MSYKAAANLREYLEKEVIKKMTPEEINEALNKLNSDLTAARQRIAELEADAGRLDWLESEFYQDGDGYTQPREAKLMLEWAQEAHDPVFPGVRPLIDRLRQQGGEHERER